MLSGYYGSALRKNTDKHLSTFALHCNKMARKSLPTSSMDDSKEFEALYKTNAAAVRRFLFWRTKDHMLADDLTSDVFEKAWRSRRQFDGRSAKAWLHTIARNALIDYWRRKKALPVDDPEELARDYAVADSSEAFDRALDAEAVRIALGKLPENTRRIIELRFIEGLSVREVAERLRLTEANVRVMQYRALRTLRGYLS